MADMPGHEMSFVGHTHVGPGKHRITGRCSCDDDVVFQSTAQSDIQARGNVREQHKRHIRRLTECESASKAG